LSREEYEMWIFIEKIKVYDKEKSELSETPADKS
jgi:hypothetical protein